VKRVEGSDGRSYASAWEREAMGWLRLRQKIGEIDALRFQVWFSLYIDCNAEAFIRCEILGLNAKRPGIRIESYVADAVFEEGGFIRIADAKHGLLTPEYRRKRTWMAALGCAITELHKESRPAKKRVTR
jgi:hypothetical protein